MFAGIGLVVLLVMVFGGFMLTGGAIGPVLHALPHEMLIIGGAAAGALIIGNSGADLKALAGGVMTVFKGPKFKKQDYLDCIFLVSKLMKTLRVEGPVALEPHIEDPKSSAIFAEYPRLMADSALIHLICDTLRLVVVSSGTLDPHAVEDVMDNALKTHHHEAVRPADNLQGLADALPALGIVAAVLGVVKTMGSIDKPPEILGGMIGSALVGTFLGVLLAYGMVGPFASRAKQVIEADGAMYHVVKQIIIASLHGHPQPLVIEAARSNLIHANQPAFAEVFDGMRGR
ncbi:chemotaxis protein MotA [Sphingobium sp. B2D3A]|uniref:flagellar motor stator protein MotA n=1 Tax=Sphingobium TaxID=165695 RepID=UPI0015EC1528|nr:MULTISPECIES: flagellar motor stator protein MotA [Sphingobium]MCW2337718.1 chemotaxis protein MotA [Sphingobium sp. B2D3A]MCW2350651.1 chemotaxis protein MotA [Sphingobium sp. B12D2B]MCW2362067.1 chemotaxis protein MotA [Sphingobium sp. B10D3B]MCW2366139.1 chemotaxis protein MotA [Sphingobium sp. B7D2B]MCW2369753.1 chemotaxis protein MotA [Sphingobium sp. B11D3D]